MSEPLENELPQTLQEAVLYFADPEKAFETVINLRWSNGVTCPHCGSKEVGYTCTRKIWKCKNKECHKQFSITANTDQTRHKSNKLKVLSRKDYIWQHIR